jgi:hypothetical protein
MSDDKSPEDTFEFLGKKGWNPTRLPPNEGKLYFVVAEYEVPHGQNAGKKIGIALPIPVDYPTTAPYGMHVKIPHLLGGNITNVQGSPLGSEWQFWSRRVNEWPIGRRNTRTYLDCVNRWLEVS